MIYVKVGDIVEVDLERYEIKKNPFRGVICDIEHTPYGKQIHIKVAPSLVVQPNRVKGNEFIVHESVVKLVKL